MLRIEEELLAKELLRAPRISVFPSHSASRTWGFQDQFPHLSIHWFGSCCCFSCMSRWRSRGGSRHLVLDGLWLLHLLVDGWAQSDLEELFSSLDIALKGHDCSSPHPLFLQPWKKGCWLWTALLAFASSWRCDKMKAALHWWLWVHAGTSVGCLVFMIPVDDTCVKKQTVGQESVKVSDCVLREVLVF